MRAGVTISPLCGRPQRMAWDRGAIAAESIAAPSMNVMGCRSNWTDEFPGFGRKAGLAAHIQSGVCGGKSAAGRPEPDSLAGPDAGREQICRPAGIKTSVGCLPLTGTAILSQGGGVQVLQSLFEQGETIA